MMKGIPRYMDLPIGHYSQSFWKSPQCSTQQTTITLSKVSKIEKRCGISYTLAFPCNAMCVCAQLCAYIHLCSKEPKVSMSGVFLGLSLSNLFFEVRFFTEPGASTSTQISVYL